MRVILLGIGTFLAILFLIQIRRGSRYESVLEGLDGMEFPLCSLYMVGFAWSSSKPFLFRGKTAGRLKREAELLYEGQYAEYYANIAWAGALTLIHLILSLTFLLAGLWIGMAGFVMVVGIFFAVFAGVYSLTKMKNALSGRSEECDASLAEVVSTMAILLNSGMILREVWMLVSRSGDTAIYRLMQEAADNMKNGMSESDAIYRFGRLSGSSEVQKFTTAMLQNIEKGGSELTNFMENQSSELWNTKRQRMLQSGERAATKLLMPTMLIFVGVLIIVITAAFDGALF